MTLTYPGSENLQISAATPPGCQPIIRPEPIIKANQIAYLIWDVADLDAQEAFLSDFGMVTYKKSKETLFMRSYGNTPYVYVGQKADRTQHIGIGFTVTTREELEKLANATQVTIEKLDRPGGGDVVRLFDPIGTMIEVVHGIENIAPIDTRRAPLPSNTPDQVNRLNSGQRPPLSPSPVLRIGHCVLGANDFDGMVQWYMKHLGTIPTDVACLADGSPNLTFMRLDLGDKPADHHTIVVTQGIGTGYMHSAYEVVDLDAIGQGQQFLMEKGYKHFWGIGRHILGSQLFDYWLDPAGFEFEHYADGDVFTSDHPTEYHPFDPGNIYAWGQDIPKAMTRPNWPMIKGIVKGFVTVI